VSNLEYLRKIASERCVSYIMKQLIPVLRSYQANKVTSTDKSITFEEELAALDQIMAILSSVCHFSY